MQEEKFSAFIPIDFIEKGKKDKDGLPEKLIISGIASSMNSGKYDVDGQLLDVNGFDYEPFLKSGFFNLEHKGREDYTNIVGEPTNAYVKDGNFYVEGELYKDNPKAVGIYQLGQILKKSGSKRKIGYSIEGRIAKKDPNNPNKIAKSIITGCAVTVSPKNDGTELLIKGGRESIEHELQPGSEYIIDIIEDGIRYTVDKNLVIEKSDSTSTAYTQNSETAEEKQRVTAKESLDTGGIKKKKDKEKQEAISKSEFYIKIFSMFNDIDKDSVKRIYTLSENIQKSINPDMSKISEEAFQKALETLGLATKTETAEEASAKAKVEEELKKAQEAKAILEKELADTLKKAEDLKNKIEGKESKKKDEDKEEGEEKEKKEEGAEMNKAIIDELQKGFNEKITSLATIIQKKDEENAELKKSLEAQSEFLTKLGEKIGIIEKQPLERKSLSGVKYIDRFEKADNGGGQDGEKVLSLSNSVDKKELTDAMWDAFEKGGMKDLELEKGMRSIEMASILGDAQSAARLADRLKREFKIKVVK